MFDALKLNHEAVVEEEEAIRNRVRAMDDLQKRAYHSAFKKKMKDPDTYAVLNYFFVAGLHHIYLDKYARGLLNMGVMLGGLILLATPAFPLGILLILGLVTIELMALFRSQIVVTDHNNKLARALLEKLDNEQFST